MKRPTLYSFTLGFTTVFSGVMIAIHPSIANATELGAESGTCGYECQQDAQQGLILCQQLENAVNTNPNDPNFQIGYSNCLTAIQKQGFCNTYHVYDMLQGNFDVRDCNVHLSDFYRQERPRW